MIMPSAENRSKSKDGTVRPKRMRKGSEVVEDGPASKDVEVDHRGKGGSYVMKDGKRVPRDED